jgi:predicted unusual protein kinase regulating ubiquinone biosynthesis (AarF/ABC1/UbiB family)
MQLKLNLVHLDLHLGNIVLIKNDGEYLPLIHDFGKSRKIDFSKSEKIDLKVSEVNDGT